MKRKTTPEKLSLLQDKRHKQLHFKRNVPTLMNR